MSGETTVSASRSTEQQSRSREKRLVEAVAEDRRLGPKEKETLLRFVKTEDRVWVYTEERGLMRRLLQHPEFRLESLQVVTEDSWGEHIDPDDFGGVPSRESMVGSRLAYCLSRRRHNTL